ncbi:MAG: hypothetical protein ACRDMZ_03595 [Solirubrobacteraceae bacterium]
MALRSAVASITVSEVMLVTANITCSLLHGALGAQGTSRWPQTPIVMRTNDAASGV